MPTKQPPKLEESLEVFQVLPGQALFNLCAHRACKALTETAAVLCSTAGSVKVDTPVCGSTRSPIETLGPDQIKKAPKQWSCLKQTEPIPRDVKLRQTQRTRPSQMHMDPHMEGFKARFWGCMERRRAQKEEGF